MNCTVWGARRGHAHGASRLPGPRPVPRRAGGSERPASCQHPQTLPLHGPNRCPGPASGVLSPRNRREGFAMAFFAGLWGPFTHASRAFSQRSFSTTGSFSAIQKMTRVRVVDNSALGNTPYHRPPRCIHVYNKSGVGKVGDRILLAIKGQKKKALIVGHRMPGPQMTPRFDSNNVVLIEDNGNPVGTRIKTPIPTSLRQREGEFSKVLAIAQNFV
uniref:Large ribosomal subunit protein uL14m n=1 Tax=Canis lupus familiaris TaxID=9615 RepID=A0A8I3N5L2_CANLF